MGQQKNTLRSVATIFCLLTIVFYFSGCEKFSSPLEPQNSEEASIGKLSTSVTTVQGGKGKGGNGGKGKGKGNQPQDPFSDIEYEKGSYTYVYSDEFRCYLGGNVRTPNGSRFHLQDGALTPPRGHKKKEPVKITMEIEKIDGQELVFTFSPSGCKFKPKGELILSWSGLGNSVPSLFGINDNGDYVTCYPDYVDIKNKKMIIYIPHFSRYALCKG